MPKKKKKTAVKKKAKPSVKRKVASKKTRKPAKKKVLAIPRGYNHITPYLIVDNGINAIEFYKNSFGAKVVLRMDRPNGKIGHAELKVGDSKFMLSDECPEMNALSPGAFGGSAISMHLYVKKVDDTIAKALAKGAKLIRPAKDMFYGDRIGTIEDPFGHLWHVSTHIEDVSPAETKKRAAQMNKYQEEQ